MSEPDYLYRITHKDLTFDQDGYLTSHFGGTLHDRRSVPLAEEVDFEALARFFLYNKLMDWQQPFLVLKVLTSEVIDRKVKTHLLLQGHEHHGFVHKNAIKSVLKGEWTRDFDQSVGEKFRKHPIGAQILEDTYGKKPIITGQLNQEEINELLNKT